MIELLIKGVKDMDINEIKSTNLLRIKGLYELPTGLKGAGKRYAMYKKYKELKG